MAQPGHSLFRRIRSVKSSLDKAEQSFLDNKDIRGELDLMLAEAELKNLRKKKDVPWSWNRHLFAACAALLLVLAGCGGWYFARDHYRQRPINTAQPAVATTRAQEMLPSRQTATKSELQSTPAVKQNEAGSKQNIAAAAPHKEKEQPQVSISKSDMHRLVQSARVELSNSK